MDYQHLGEFSMPAMYPSPFGNSQYSNNDFESGLQEDEQDYFQLVLVDGSFGVISCQTGRCSICGAYQCLHCRAAKQNKLNLSGSNSVFVPCVFCFYIIFVVSVRSSCINIDLSIPCMVILMLSIN